MAAWSSTAMTVETYGLENRDSNLFNENPLSCNSSRKDSIQTKISVEMRMDALDFAFSKSIPEALEVASTPNISSLKNNSNTMIEATVPIKVMATIPAILRKLVGLISPKSLQDWPLK